MPQHATQATAGVPEQASPGETLNGLTSVQSAVDAIRDQTAVTIRHVGEVQQLQQFVMVGPADEVNRPEHLVLPGHFDQPVLLGSITGDGQCGTRVGTPDLR